jgi:hypothetical protein
MRSRRPEFVDKSASCSLVLRLAISVPRLAPRSGACRVAELTQHRARIACAPAKSDCIRMASRNALAASREIAVEHSQNYWHAHNRALLDKLFA